MSRILTVLGFNKSTRTYTLTLSGYSKPFNVPAECMGLHGFSYWDAVFFPDNVLGNMIAIN